MSNTIESLWEKGWDAANNPGRWVRVKHSAFARKYKKPDQMLRTAVMGAVQAIPVPVVGTLVDMAVNAAIDQAKSFRLGRKIKSYGSGANLEKEVKHKIKGLNLEELDRARAKVKSSADALNRHLASAKWIDDQNLCEHILDIAQGFHYLDKRLEVLDTRAAVFEKIAQDTREWCKTIRDSIDERKTQCDTQIGKLKNKDRLFHENCDKKLCIT